MKTKAKFRLTLEFESDEHRHQFTAWFLDGGGDQGFDQFLEMHDQPYLSTTPPGKDWDWNIPGSGGGNKPSQPVTTPGQNYTIKMVATPRGEP